MWRVVLDYFEVLEIILKKDKLLLEKLMKFLQYTFLSLQKCAPACDCCAHSAVGAGATPGPVRGAGWSGAGLGSARCGEGGAVAAAAGCPLVGVSQLFVSGFWWVRKFQTKEAAVSSEVFCI